MTLKPPVAAPSVEPGPQYGAAYPWREEPPEAEGHQTSPHSFDTGKQSALPSLQLVTEATLVLEPRVVAA